MKKQKEIKTDISLTYIIPMYKKGSNKTDKVHAKIISCNNGFLVCECIDSPDYERHGFWDEYFQWLLYTDYVKVCQEN